jgi:pentatricopeptide repeat protein
MYNIVLQAWVCCGNITAAEDWMQNMRRAGMADSDSFNILIKALVRARTLDRATALMREMQDMGIRASTLTFNELLTGCVQASRFLDGMSLLEEMHVAGVRPDISTQDALIRLLNCARSVDHGFELVCETFVNTRLSALRIAELSFFLVQISTMKA